jgi:hypothetical protein
MLAKQISPQVWVEVGCKSCLCIVKEQMLKTFHLEGSVKLIEALPGAE